MLGKMGLIKIIQMFCENNLKKFGSENLKYKIKLFDAEGHELNIENKVIRDITFESEQAINKFINAIRGLLPSGFHYHVIPQKEK